ncbi:hypothetical protein A6V36_21070 [Paraburkholderia ginsengiterrae]|uniref:Uncharacterized protein n=1 Tax=Paraburkholderia ginsengiterrae TaxID=1462993 RepID=A0A1A9NB24_9BURK|nr:hypothetical protein [Paraburkholderia ginsengiterrae]OAJ62444.1 hypothetical protein A6V36_21070 [Paraburkholderia ginsengiterrae]OAJ62571.1 hypothetical protein A6V37_22360 [Paraburkholderia ginsengiterrae]
MRVKKVATAIVSAVIMTHAYGTNVSSISRIEFGPNGVLFVADWRASRIEAIRLPAAPAVTASPYNIDDLALLLSRAVGGAAVRVADMKVRPGTGLVYVAYEFGPTGIPAIAEVTSQGSVRNIDLNAAGATDITLKNATTANVAFWGKIPERSMTVTDMRWNGNELFVAGLSNQSFASSLWRMRYPFDGNPSLTSIEIYHTTHNQVETRAPIRTMTFANLNGTSYLVAAYMCTPLVTIPLDALVDGAHVRGKTIAELGFGNTPSDMISFSSTGQSGTTTNILLTNYERSADLMPVSTIANANAGSGLTQWVPFGQIQGIQPEALPLSGVKRIDNLSDQYVVALRDNVEWNKTQLVTYDKSYFFRSSDYVSEYAFPGYQYPPGFETNVIEPVEKQLMQEEGYTSPFKIY